MLNDKRSPSFGMFSLLVCCGVCVWSFAEGTFEPMNLFVWFGDRNMIGVGIKPCIKCDMWGMTDFFPSGFFGHKKNSTRNANRYSCRHSIKCNFYSRSTRLFLMAFPTGKLERNSNQKIHINRSAYVLVLDFDHINYCEILVFPADHRSAGYTPMAANAFMWNCSNATKSDRISKS